MRRLTAISDILITAAVRFEGRLHGSRDVPWHAWGTAWSPQGPRLRRGAGAGTPEARADGYVSWPIAPRELLKHQAAPSAGGARPSTRRAAAACSGISTTAMDDGNPRFSTSDDVARARRSRAGELKAGHAAHQACARLNFGHCEGNYSKASHAVYSPCAITERDPGDQLTGGLRGAGTLG